MSVQRRPMEPLTIACTACGCGDMFTANASMGQEGRKEIKDYKCSVFKTDAANECPTFPVEGNGRYSLCPFAARPWLIAEMTGLRETGAVKVFKAFPGNGKEGWFFTPQNEEEHTFVNREKNCVCWDIDEPTGHKRVREFYEETAEKENVSYTGAISLPIFYDNKKGLIVSNDSMDISWMLAVEFADYHSAEWKASGIQLFPEYLDDQHAALIQDIHNKINTAVYRTHMDTSQEGYESKLAGFWSDLDAIGRKLQHHPFLMTGEKGSGGEVHGGTPVFADLMLFATLIRLDLAYGPAFRIGCRRVRDSDSLFGFVRRMWRMKGVKDSQDLRGIICTYYTSVPLRAKNGGTIPLIPEGFREALEKDPDSFIDGQESASLRKELERLRTILHAHKIPF